MKQYGTRETGCQGKIRYPDKQKVKKTRKRLKRKEKRNVSYYSCIYCLGYHIGTRNNF